MARKLLCAKEVCADLSWLQWSRANNGAETGGSVKAQRAAYWASMEPRQQWRGNSQSRREGKAMDTLQWSRANNGAETKREE